MTDDLDRTIQSLQSLADRQDQIAGAMARPDRTDRILADIDILRRRMGQISHDLGDFRRDITGRVDRIGRRRQG